MFICISYPCMYNSYYEIWDTSDNTIECFTKEKLKDIFSKEISLKIFNLTFDILSSLDGEDYLRNITHYILTDKYFIGFDFNRFYSPHDEIKCEPKCSFTCYNRQSNSYAVGNLHHGNDERILHSFIRKLWGRSQKYFNVEHNRLRYKFKGDTVFLTETLSIDLSRLRFSNWN